jgi:hypothetical protein
MKKTAFRILFVVFVAAVIGWLFYTPRSPHSLMRAIPEHAALVTVHRDIAGRYAALLDNPFAASLMNSAGIPLDELRRELNEPANARLIKLLLSGQCTFSYVPPSVHNRSAMWAFTDWLGGRATLVQLALNWGRIPYVKDYGVYKGIPVYRLKVPGAAQTDYIVFGIVEGGLIGCISPDPGAVKQLISLYLSGNRSAVRRYQTLNDDPAMRTASDKGWYVPPRTDDVCPFSISVIASNRFHAALEIPGAPPARDRAPATFLAQETRRLLGSLPSLVIGTTASNASALLLPNVPQSWHPAIRVVSEQTGDVPLTIALLGEEYSGRFMRMKLPSIMLAFSLPDSVDPNQLINTCLDRINAGYRAGLVPEAVPVAGGRTVYVLQGTAAGSYAETPFNERMACTVISNLLMVSSSAQSLIKLTARYDRDESAADAEHAVWFHELSAGPDCAAALWLDFVKSGKSIRLGIAAYAFNLLRESSENGETARLLISDAEAWTTALEPMQQLTVTCSVTGTHYALNIQAGPREQASGPSASPEAP